MHLQGKVDAAGSHVGCKGAQWEPRGTPRQLEVQAAQLPSRDGAKGAQEHSEPLCTPLQVALPGVHACQSGEQGCAEHQQQQHSRMRLQVQNGFSLASMIMQSS